MCLGGQWGLQMVLKLESLKKNRLAGITFEFKNQFYKCKMVSSSSEKHPGVFINHSLNRSQQNDAAVNNANSTLGSTGEKLQSHQRQEGRCSVPGTQRTWA